MDNRDKLQKAMIGWLNEDTHYIPQLYQCGDCGAIYDEDHLPTKPIKYPDGSIAYQMYCNCGSENIHLLSDDAANEALNYRD